MSRTSFLLGLSLVAALAATPSLVGAPDDGRITTWAAPPYWTPTANQPDGGERTGREAFAAGRQPLAPPQTALPFIALTPCRVVDTRGNAPLTGGFLPPATVRSYTLTGTCGIPANAQAVSLNATVVRPTGPGFLVLYPQGAALPPVSTLNFVGNDVVANAAVVSLSGAGGLSMVLGVSGGDVILDTNGYYAPLPAESFTGPLAGDVIGTQGATVVSSVGGQSASNVAAGAVLANTATSTNTAGAIVRRDASGNIGANVVTADGGYRQPGAGGETLRMVRGVFRCNPISAAFGSGYTVVRNSVGDYTVFFSTPFSGIPAALWTVLASGPQTSSLVSLAAGHMEINTFDPTGALFDPLYISFLGVGPP